VALLEGCGSAHVPHVLTVLAAASGPDSQGSLAGEERLTRGAAAELLRLLTLGEKEGALTLGEDEEGEIIF